MSLIVAVTSCPPWLNVGKKVKEDSFKVMLQSFALWSL